MAQVKFYLEKRGDRETNIPILLAYSFHGQRLIYYTGLRVDERYYNTEYWKGTEKGNRRKPIKSTAPKADYLNDQLEILSRHIGAAENEAKAAGIPLTPGYFRDYLNGKVKERPDPEEQVTFFTYFDQFIEEQKTAINKKTGQPVSPANAIKYTTVKNLLMDFCKYSHKKIDFSDFDSTLYNELVNYMIYQKRYTLNTYGRTIKFIKSVLSKAASEGKNNSIKYQSAFKGVTEQSDNAYLTEEELNTLFSFDFSPWPRLDRVRDIFLIGCWTGLRFSDYSTLRREHIVDDKIKLIMKKTKRPVIIPLNQTVKRIFEKYNYQLPPAISNQKFNEYLQEVCKRAGINSLFSKTITRGRTPEIISGEKHLFISSHSARRTFATNMFNRGVKPYLIMRITGHSTEREFFNYLKITAEEQAAMFQKEAGEGW